MAYPGAAYRQASPQPQYAPQPQVIVYVDPNAPAPNAPPPAYDSSSQSQPYAPSQPIGYAPQQQFYQQPVQPVAGPYGGPPQATYAQGYQQPVPQQGAYSQQVYYQGQPGYQGQQYPPRKQEEIGTGAAIAGGCCAACLACQCLACLGECLGGLE